MGRQLGNPQSLEVLWNWANLIIWDKFTRSLGQVGSSDWSLLPSTCSPVYSQELKLVYTLLGEGSKVVQKAYPAS